MRGTPRDRRSSRLRSPVRASVLAPGTLVLIAAACVLLARPTVRTSAPSAAAAAAAEDRRPDLVLVLVDALRADALSLYGQSRATTPNLVRRRQALRWFTDVITESTHTAPAVASLFTGAPPRVHRIQYDTIGTFFPPHGKTPMLDTALPTLAETLRAHGYATLALTGNPWLTSASQYDRGFDRFEGWQRWTRHEVADDAAIVGAASEALDASGPRFVYAHLMAVHNPYDKGHRSFVRTAGVDRYVNGRASASGQDTAYMRELYDSNVAFVDALLERFIARAARRVSARPLVLCVLGDHGEEFQEHGGFGHGTTLHHEQARVPVVFWGPGVVTRTGPSSAPLALSDVRRLLVALAGVAPDRILGLLSDREAPPVADPDRVRTVELNNEKGLYQGRWKYIVQKSPLEERLYDHFADPAERINLANSPQGAAVLPGLRATVRRMWPDVGYAATAPAALPVVPTLAPGAPSGRAGRRTH